MSYVFRPTVSANWGPNYSTVSEIAGRFSAMLHALADVDRRLAGWRRHARRPPRSTLTLEPGALEKLIAAEQLRDDFGGILPGAGSTIYLWNGESEPDYVTIRATLGASVAEAGNCCEIGLPEAARPDDPLLAPETLRKLLRIQIDCWDPDWATVASLASIARSNSNPSSPGVGWITWFPSRFGAPPLLDATWTVEPLAAGFLLTLGSKFEDSSHLVTEQARAALVAVGYIS